MNKKNSLNNCQYCGEIFSNEILQKIGEHNPIICELCGYEFKLNNNPVRTEINEDLMIKSKNKIKSWFGHYYEITRTKRSQVARILEDNDFSMLFKENFIIVASCLIFLHFKSLEHELSQNIKKIKLIDEVLDRLYQDISPITSKRIKHQYLSNLNKISIKEFEKWLRKLQEKFLKIKYFRKDFEFFLQWLIKEVYLIITEKWEKDDLPKFEDTILKNLIEFSFYCYKNNEIEFRNKSKINFSFNLDNNSDIIREKRFQIERLELKLILEVLKGKGISLNKLRRLIGMSVEHYYHGRTSSINEKSFQILESLFGKRIPHKVILGKILRININDDERLSEFLGIMLGDGGLYLFPKATLSITLNRIDEEDYVNYVRNFIYNLFLVYPSETIKKNDKSIIFRLYGYGITDFLISKGFKPGDKVRNQISVPNWIKKKRNFIITCLKGLFDTDGSIAVDSSHKSIKLSFTNASFPLVKDFKQMCQRLGIKSQAKIVKSKTKTKTGKKYGYKVFISAKSEVNKFLNIINPEKWRSQDRLMYNGIRLILINSPKNLQKKIINQISKDFPRKIDRKYSKNFTYYLNDLCMRYGLNTDWDSVNQAITNALNYKN